MSLATGWGLSEKRENMWQVSLNTLSASGDKGVLRISARIARWAMHKFSNGIVDKK